MTKDVYTKLYSGKSEAYYSRHSPFLQRCLDELSFSPKTALDLGCGDGRNTVFLMKEYGTSVTCIDLSAAGLKKIRRYADALEGSVATVEAGISSFPWETQKVDLIVIATVLDNLTENQITEVFEKLSSLKGSNTFVFCSAFNERDPSANEELSSRHVSETGVANGYYFQSGELKERFNFAEILRYEETYEEDKSHGEPHFHGMSRVFAKV